MSSARSIHVQGIVQGVGFRPFVYRLARAHSLSGWVLNGEQGVQIFIEGSSQACESFVRDLKLQAPPAARIVGVSVEPAEPQGLLDFTIRSSTAGLTPTTRVSPDLPVCDACLAELCDPSNRRFQYPYINCTNCGPRYTVILALPYDRPNTTMKRWPLDDYCAAEYADPANRRFHAQPVACPACGPQFFLVEGTLRVAENAVQRAAQMLRDGRIVAVKGLGGYHLACDARNAQTIAALRERKFRKEKPFALMARDLDVARSLVELKPASEALMTSTARPIVLAPAKAELPGVAPHNHELGVMLPYTPLHHLLYALGAPEALVMTSANRSSEPIAYEDDEALRGLEGLTDAFLVGQRPIARRVDDSVVRVGSNGPAILRRARGYAPGAAAVLPSERPLLAVGADLKNTITLVVNGQAFVSQHIGDLEHYAALRAFEETIRDLTSMYEVRWDDLLVVHDAHPQYASTVHALKLPAAQKQAVQHHRAHIASVLAETGEFDRFVLGVSFDGTGFGDDGAIWGGEIFTGSVRHGFQRVAHLRPAALAGGDAAALFPVQAAAGFLSQVESATNLCAAPFHFPDRYRHALQLVEKNVRTFPTTSMGRLFDCVAALLGFTREVSFEGQAAIWLEQLARTSCSPDAYPFPFTAGTLDFRPMLAAVIEDRRSGRDVRDIARDFQRGLAVGLFDCVRVLSSELRIDTIVCSGGVFQNDLLVEDLQRLLATTPLRLLTNHVVPPNDGGISFGQAAIAAHTTRRP